jgi:hypothetical protein
MTPSESASDQDHSVTRFIERMSFSSSFHFFLTGEVTTWRVYEQERLASLEAAEQNDVHASEFRPFFAAGDHRSLDPRGARAYCEFIPVALKVNEELTSWSSFDSQLQEPSR